MPGRAKIAAFAMVLLTAAVLIANSLRGRGAASLARQGGEGAGHSCPYGEAGYRAARDSMPMLAELIGDNDFVFVVLRGDGEEQAEALRGPVDAALAKIASGGASPTSLTLGADADGHSELTGSFAIESFPSVVAIGRSHRAAAVSGEITEAKLLRAFEVASTPAPGCGDCDAATCPQAQ